MNERDVEAKIRIDALLGLDGVARLDGAPFDGIGLVLSAAGLLALRRYRNGVEQGLVADLPVDLDLRTIFDQADVSYADDGATILAAGRPLTGSEAGFDGRHLVRLSEYRNGEPTGRELRWFPTGALQSLRDVESTTDAGAHYVEQAYLWSEDGHLTNSTVHIRGPGLTTGGSVGFDDDGAVTVFGALSGYFDRVVDFGQSIRSWAWTSTEQLHRQRVGSQLTILATAPELQGSILDALAADDGLEALGTLEVVSTLEVDQIQRLLQLPNLTEVTIGRGDRATYEALLAFKRRWPNATVRLGGIALLDDSELETVQRDQNVSAHFYDPTFSELVGWQQWTNELSEDELARLEGSRALRYVHAIGVPDPDASRELEGQLRRLKAARPDVLVKISGQELT